MALNLSIAYLNFNARVKIMLLMSNLGRENKIISKRNIKIMRESKCCKRISRVKNVSITLVRDTSSFKLTTNPKLASGKSENKSTYQKKKVICLLTE